jgi:hypothetical protein
VLRLDETPALAEISDPHGHVEEADPVPVEGAGNADMTPTLYCHKSLDAGPR